MVTILIIASVFLMSGCYKSAEDMVKATEYCAANGMAVKTYRHGNGIVSDIYCTTPTGDEFTVKY